MNRAVAGAGIMILIAMLVGCFESERVRVVRVSVPAAKMQKGNGFRYFNVEIFTYGIGTDFSDTKISDIVSVGYQIWLDNDDDASAEFQMYASPVCDSMDYSHSDSIMKYVTLVFASPPIAPGGYRAFDWPESMQYSVNRESLRAYLRQRSATFYLITDSPLLSVDSLAVIVTVKIVKQ